MSDDIKTDSHKVLRYRDRTWDEVDSPVGPSAEWEKAIRVAGYILETTFGCPGGWSVDMYSSMTTHTWLFDFSTSTFCHQVVVERWQDLIDFMAHISTSMLMAIVPEDTTQILEDLCDKTPTRVDGRARARALLKASAKPQTP